METNAVINILWIEDNPLISTESKIDSGETKLDAPSILLKNQKGVFFRLKILQHPEEIKEYLSLCNLVIEKRGQIALGKCEGVIPDIVVFDYMLANNFHGQNPNSISYKEESKNVRELLNPNYSIAKVHSDLILTENLFSENAIGYTKTKFITSINNSQPVDVNAELKKLGNDEFGLFAGVAIARFFKNHITCALPATYEKDRIDKLHPTAKYYEWLNKFDLGDALGRENRGSKSWKDIIEDGVELLKKHIKTQVSEGKIIISYSHLISLSENGLAASIEFNFSSAFGERVLPLDGLFLDEKKEIQNEKIKTWAAEILEKMPLTNGVIKKSIDLSTQLWNAYLNCFEDRMILSDYTYRLAGLNNDENKYLIELKKRLDVDAKTGLILDRLESSVKSLLKSEKDISVKRLTVLKTVTHAAIQLEKQRVESGMSEKYAPLSNWEYFNILFPKINLAGKLLLPMHYQSETDKSSITETDRKWLFRNLTTNENKVAEANLFQFSSWISKGEKEVLKSIFYNEKMYHPEWLK